jgi:release factor glutamine methyltransferase
MNLVSGLQLKNWRNNAIKEAIASGISPTEVDWILREIADVDRLSLRLGTFADQTEITLSLSLDDLKHLWQCRLQENLPVQYLVGVTPWRNFSLKVTPDVLIPRPETEYLIDLVMKLTLDSSLNGGNWVDLGTGSGAIALGLANSLTKAQIYAVDGSSKALGIAQYNAQKYNLTQRIKFYQGDWWSPLTHLQGKITGMVSNPPYIPSNMIPDLQIEVSKHEPHVALDGGQDGLDSIRYLIETAPLYLISGGIWLIEFMAGQGQQISELLTNNGNYNQIQIISDLADFDRYALAYRI